MQLKKNNRTCEGNTFRILTAIDQDERWIELKEAIHVYVQGNAALPLSGHYVELGIRKPWIRAPPDHSVAGIVSRRSGF